MKILVTLTLTSLILMFLGTTYSFAQITDELIVAPEVLFNGSIPAADDMLFKPGRILDENTIWFSANRYVLFEEGIHIYRSIDGGASFTYNATPIPGRAAQMDAFDANIAIVATDQGDIYRTTDGGTTWIEVYSYELEGAEWFDGCRILNENVAVAYGDGRANGEMHFVRSEDKGETWTEIEGIDYLSAYNGYYTWGLAACNVGERIWCTAYDSAGDTAFVFRSYDAGSTWDSFHIPVDIVAIGDRPRSVAFINNTQGMITTDPGYMVKTSDGGDTWAATNNPDASGTFVNGVVAIPNSDIIVGMDDVGVFYTTDLGATWSEITTPSETDDDYIIGGVFLNPNFGYVFTYNGQVLRFENQVTAISDPEVVNVPNKYHLSQNYPNPFNPETKISFSIPKSGDVTIKIFDIQGREVTTLVNAAMNAGTHEVVWNGTNASGERVASGMYIYTMKSQNMVLSKKMVLMK